MKTLESQKGVESHPKDQLEEGEAWRTKVREDRAKGTKQITISC